MIMGMKGMVDRIGMVVGIGMCNFYREEDSNEVAKDEMRGVEVNANVGENTIEIEEIGEEKGMVEDTSMEGVVEVKKLKMRLWHLLPNIKGK